MIVSSSCSAHVLKDYSTFTRFCRQYLRVRVRFLIKNLPNSYPTKVKSSSSSDLDSEIIDPSLAAPGGMTLAVSWQCCASRRLYYGHGPPEVQGFGMSHVTGDSFLY